MGASKTGHYTTSELNMSKLAKALAHPARWRIASLIAERGPISCYQIMQEMPLSQPTISQHLIVLQHCGMITSVYLYNETIYYHLSGRALSLLSDGVYELFFTNKMDKVIS